MLTALRPRTTYDRDRLILESKTHGLVLIGEPSEDCWRGQVWRITSHYRQRTGKSIVPLSHLRLWLRWDVASEDGWGPAESLPYCGRTDEMILDALNAPDSGVAVYRLARPLRGDE